MTSIRSRETVLQVLQYQIRTRLRLQAEIFELTRSGLPAAFQQQELKRLQQDDEEARARCMQELDDLLMFPPDHIGHETQLAEFWKAGGYHRSVFIMTKFPRPPASATAKDAELEKVLAAVSKAVKDANFIPRIARDARYHPMLWDNVELHLLGCRQGIAVVEDRYLPELNPNVVMEWGWLRAMKKPVLFLIEKDFENLRADLSGLLSDTFPWDTPEASIGDAVTAFLEHQEKQLPPGV